MLFRMAYRSISLVFFLGLIKILNSQKWQDSGENMDITHALVSHVDSAKRVVRPDRSKYSDASRRELIDSPLILWGNLRATKVNVRNLTVNFYNS